MNPSESEIYEFGPFRFDTSNLMLFKDGEVLPLPPKALDTLAVLVRNQGKVVEKSALIQAVWPDTFVEENNLSQNISALRKVLGDPDYIQTVTRRGFRFVAQTRRSASAGLGTAAGAAADPTLQAPPAEKTFVPARRPARWTLWLALAAGLIVAVAGARSYLARRARPGSGKVMMVVLPFLNLSGDPSREYLADGMTEEMITQLGSLDPAHLGVIARTSAMQYKDTHKDVTEIARELGVNYLLEGSVRRAGDRVRVTAQLIQTSDQTHIWADSFDRNVSDILQLESDVARAIAAKTELALSKQTEARLAVTPHVDAGAHEAYLLGLQSWNLRTQEGVKGAIADFKRAIAIDPNYALAFAGLARAYSLAPVFDVLAPSDSLPMAREAATRAVGLDDSVADAHTTLAFIDAHYDHDWKSAEREFRRAIELNPSYAYAHFF